MHGPWHFWCSYCRTRSFVRPRFHHANSLTFFWLTLSPPPPWRRGVFQIYGHANMHKTIHPSIRVCRNGITIFEYRITQCLISEGIPYISKSTQRQRNWLGTVAPFVAYHVHLHDYLQLYRMVMKLKWVWCAFKLKPWIGDGSECGTGVYIWHEHWTLNSARQRYWKCRHGVWCFHSFTAVTSEDSCLCSVL